MSQLTGLPFDTMPSTQTVVPTTNEHPAQRHTAGQLPGQTLPQLCMQRLGRARPGILHFLNPNTSCKPLQAGGIVTSKRPVHHSTLVARRPKASTRTHTLQLVLLVQVGVGVCIHIYHISIHIYNIYTASEYVYKYIYIYMQTYTCIPILDSRTNTPEMLLINTFDF